MFINLALGYISLRWLLISYREMHCTPVKDTLTKRVGDGIRDPYAPAWTTPLLATLQAAVVKGQLMRGTFISSTFDGCVAPDTAGVKVEEGGKMISVLRMAKPHGTRHERPIEVIFKQYNREAAPPRLPSRAAEHPVSR
jgi:hypothetical protein